MSKAKRSVDSERGMEPVIIDAPEMADVLDDATPAAEPVVVARDKSSGKPYCARHNCLMLAQRSSEVATHYKCRVKDCDAVEVRMRPDCPAPIEPQWCPECRGSFGREVACETSARRSDPFNLVMICPQCKWEVQVPRPTAARTVERLQQRAPVENILSIPRAAF